MSLFWVVDTYAEFSHAIPVNINQSKKGYGLNQSFYLPEVHRLSPTRVISHDNPRTIQDQNDLYISLITPNL
jgi:hypothetical protein